MKFRSDLIIVVPLVGLILTGCATAPTEYTAFAQAGAGYAAAVDKLLTSAGVAQVDSTSWTLIMEKATTGMNDEIYGEKDQADKARLKVISRLRIHARLLARYFGYLESLATSDAPEKTKIAIEGVVANLEKLPLSMPSSVSALPAFGKIAVSFRIKKALRQELDKRKDIIRNELKLQEELLKELTGDITHALALEKSAKEQQLVMDPITSEDPLKSEEKWVLTRREVVYMPITVEEMQLASGAARKMREAFEALLSGEDASGRINALITDVESILDVIDAINS